MNPEAQAFLTKAMQSLSAAEMLLQNGFADFAASRAYYAMFYAAEALLVEHALAFSSHKAVVSAFGKEFAKSGAIDPALHTALIQAQRLRHAGDYESAPQVNDEQARRVIDDAGKFIQAANAKLSNQ